MARKSTTLKHATANDAAENAKPVAAVVVDKAPAASKPNNAKLIKAQEKELALAVKAKDVELRAIRKQLDDTSDEMAAEENVLRRQIGGLQKQLDKLLDKNQKTIDKLEKQVEKQVTAATKRHDKAIATLEAAIAKLQA